MAIQMRLHNCAEASVQRGWPTQQWTRARPRMTVTPATRRRLALAQLSSTPEMASMS
jgi:hypothetical protein